MDRNTDTEQLQWNLFGQRGAIFGDSINRQCIEYRYSNGITIPFITVYFDDMPYMIDTITIGPVDLDTEQRNIQCEILRERLFGNYENAEVHYSNAPVRY